MHGHDIMVLGASLGGVEALSHLVRDLPPGLPAALFVVCHFPEYSWSYLPQILSRQGPLLATHAQNGEPIRRGHIYVAPPGLHLTLRPGYIQLTRGPRENHHRPAIDPLFRTAARAYGPRIVGVVLSGSLFDGSAGLLAIRSAGGVAIIQDPQEAFAASMPQNAWEIAGADHVLPLVEIAPLLTRLAREPVSDDGDANMPDPLDHMPELVNRDMSAQEDGARQGALTVFTCPECGGAMWQVDQSELVRFSCHVGHAFYADKLLAEQSEVLEAALWTAVRTFKEKTVLARQLAARERVRGNLTSAERFEDEAQVAEQYAELIHERVLKTLPTPDLPGDNEPVPDLPPRNEEAVEES
jgi:two-component system chemotaxis response regulator CheB